MASWSNITITKLGAEKLAEAATGELLAFTRLAAGDGALNGGIAPLATAMAHEIVSVPPSSIAAEGQAVRVRGDFGPQLKELSFFFREIGLFAKLGAGDEFLIAYGNAGDYADWVSGVDSSSIVEKAFDLVLTFSTEAEVSVTVDSEVLVSRRMLQDGGFDLDVASIVVNGRSYAVEIDELQRSKLGLYPSVLHALAYAQEGELCSISTHEVQRFPIPQLSHPIFDGFDISHMSVMSVVHGYVYMIFWESELKPEPRMIRMVFRLQDMLNGESAVLIYLKSKYTPHESGEIFENINGIEENSNDEIVFRFLDLCVLNGKVHLGVDGGDGLIVSDVEAIEGSGLWGPALDFYEEDGTTKQKLSDYKLFVDAGRLVKVDIAQNAVAPRLVEVIGYEDEGFSTTDAIYGFAAYLNSTAVECLKGYYYMVHGRLFNGEHAYIFYNYQTIGAASLFVFLKGSSYTFSSAETSPFCFFIPHANGVLSLMLDEGDLKVYEMPSLESPMAETVDISAYQAIGSGALSLWEGGNNYSVFSLKVGIKMHAGLTDGFDNLSYDQSNANHYVINLKHGTFPSGCSSFPIGNDNTLCDRACNISLRHMLKLDGKLLPVLS